MTQASAARILVCSCERTMTLDRERIRAALGPGVAFADQLCGADQAAVEAALAEGGPLVIGCTAMAPLFEELAEAAGRAGETAYANIRETAGWGADGGAAGPKMAALLAAAAEPMRPVATVSAESRGVVLILGRDGVALEAGRRLAGAMDVTVLLTPGAEAVPPARVVFPVAEGRVTAATGHLGAFDLAIESFALARPSSRARLEFGAARDGARSRADVVLDLTGAAPLFAGHPARPGYLRADPAREAAVLEAVLAAADLVGSFDRPRYVTLEPALCAHSRSRRTGCTRCLELCPAGAIRPDGDQVAIDPMICAGCGQCAAACPTGAAAYALPPAEALVRRLRTLLRTYRAAGGGPALVLLHDRDHGEPLLEALGRFGPGLPAHALPLGLNEIGQTGPEALAAALAYGAGAVRLLAPARAGHDPAGLRATLDLVGRIASDWGYGAGAVGLIETDDPDALSAALAAVPVPARAATASFLPPGAKRQLLEVALTELHRVAPTPTDSVPLPPGAPVGGIDVRTDGCTLCLACVSACPVGALGDHPERPELSFDESLCVQCGLCEATCPERVITLAPRLDIAAWTAGRRVLKAEEPVRCTECGKAFGTRASIDRVKAKLESHWMFAGEAGRARARILEMCEDCRVRTVTAESFDPHGAPERSVRTTADYLRERELAERDPGAGDGAAEGGAERNGAGPDGV